MNKEIDIDTILAPIEGKSPVGKRTFIRDQIMKGKKYDKHIDPIDNTEVEIKPNWEKIVETSLEALEKKTKDLWIAALLTEALIHTQGLTGICTGLKIQTGLLRNYWENVYPSKDNEGEDVNDILEPRFSPINYMNDTLPGRIKEIPITDASKTEGYSWIKWQESRGADGKDSKTAYGFVDDTIEKLSAGDFDSAVNSSSKNFYESFAKDIALSLKALKDFEEIVNKSFGESFTLTKRSPLFELDEKDIPAGVLEKLKPLQNKEYINEVEFVSELEANIGKEETSLYKSLILENAKKAINAPSLDKIGDAVKKCEKVVMEILKDKRALEPDPETGMQPEEDIEGDGDELHPSSRTMRDGQLMGNQFSDGESQENIMWKDALRVLRSMGIRKALGQLFEASCSIPSVRGKNRYNLLMAKLCMKAQRPELARPIVEDLFKLIEELNLERWESPMWIAEVYDVLYQCLATGTATAEDKKRAEVLFTKICTIDITKRI